MRGRSQRPSHMILHPALEIRDKSSGTTRVSRQEERPDSANPICGFGGTGLFWPAGPVAQNQGDEH